MKKICRLLIVSLLLCILLCGCTKSTPRTSEKTVRPMVEAMLNALIAEDYDTCRELFADEYAQGTMRSTFRRMTAFLDGAESYELTLVGMQRNIFRFNSQITLRYSMDTGDRQFYVDAVYSSDFNQFISFYISDAAEGNDSPLLIAVSGTWGSFANSNLLQKGLLFLHVLEIAFVLFTFVHCLCNPIRAKLLWLVLILLGVGLIGLHITPDSYRIDYGLATLIHYTSLMRFNSDLVVLRICVPVGSIVYWFEGRMHIKKPKNISTESAAADDPNL